VNGSEADTVCRRQSLMRLAAMAAASLWPGTHARAVAATGYEVSRWPASQPVPRLEVTDLDGKLWRLQDLRGRAVLLNFWASWCEPCRAEMPALQQIGEFYGSEKLLVLAINFKESAARAARYAKDTALVLPVLPDPSGTIAKAWGASVFPTTVLIGVDGKPRQRVRGEMDWTSPAAARLIEPLLRREKPRPQR
jgi:thiol-disulfide isomerase/thioredoxin